VIKEDNMGFLDHSTNNIIIDAVLTDFGRQRLAENNGQFRIEYFSLGDDEVDYGIIKKFGRTVGKEKITKNTPIFEAQTKAMGAIKNRALTLPNPTLTKMPFLSLVNQASDVVAFQRIQNGQGQFQPLTITAAQRTSVNAGADATPEGVRDTSFTLYVNSRFLDVQNGTQLSIEPITRVAAYSIQPPINANQEFTFSLVARTITTESFNQFGIVSGGVTTITTPISLVGDGTGLRKDFKVTLSNQ